MNRQYEVVWSIGASKDLEQIIQYIATDNLSNALEILRKIKDKASSPYRLPERGRVVPELQDQGIMKYRELIISPWRLVYRISHKSVYVLSVLDSRRNVEDILLQRLVKDEF
jgi:plasmid stabilization system protein ParE